MSRCVIDICICTHNPRSDILKLSIDSILHQKTIPADISVVLVDNGSVPAISCELLEPLDRAGIASRLVRETKLGLSNARLRAISETNGDWLLFVDDEQ